MIESPLRIVVRDRAVGIEVPEPSDRQMVAAVLGGFPTPGSREPVHATYAVVRENGAGWTLRAHGVATHHAATIDDALLALEWQLVTDMVSATTDRLHLHGSALADPSGAMTVLLLGPSGVGKTTLTLALMARGFAPYADDVVLIDVNDLTPLTFPRAFHVDPATRQLVQNLPHDPAWEVPGLPDRYFLPAAWAASACPVGAMVLPRARDHARPLLVRLPVAQAATALLQVSGTLDTAPALALKAVARLTAAAPCYALYGGPLSPTAELIASEVARLHHGRGQDSSGPVP